MKKIILVICTVLLAGINQFTNAQTANSQNHGSWFNPLTWDCMCIPSPSYDVNINHNITIDTSWAVNGGSIMINTNASLKQGGLRGLAVWGGSLVNNGELSFSQFALLGGTFSNNGKISNVDSLYLAVNLINGSNGEIFAHDMYNISEFTNNGSLNAINFFNDSVFYNNGTSVFTNFFNNYGDTAHLAAGGSIYFHDFTNAGGFKNDGVLYGSANFTNSGYFEHNGTFEVAVDFSNVDTVYQNAQLYVNSMIIINNNFYNANYISGTTGGQICITSWSANGGTIEGDVDICDASMPAAIVDSNTGTIGANVTQCLSQCATGLSENTDSENPSVYPNPAQNFVSFVFSDKYNQLVISDLSGRIIHRTKIDGKSNLNLSVESYEKGIYFYSLSGSDSRYNGRFIVK